VNQTKTGAIARLAEFLHHRFLWLLLGAYVLAGVVPEVGLWIRSTHIMQTDVFALGGMSLSAVFLSILLFNAGLGVEPKRLRKLFSSLGVLLAGLTTNLVVPLVFILGLSLTLTFWHNPTEVQYILVGVGLIASMPIAGSSTAWSQNANGDVALSLGLVLGSTFLSPLTTPAVLHTVGWVAEGTFAECLHQLATNGTSEFLVMFVMVPSFGGILVRCLVGERIIRQAKPVLKLINSVVLLTLCYANGAVSLPKTFANPDWDFLAVMLVVVLSLCTLGFAAGLLLSTCFRTDSQRRISLMFGLGMTNNGTGLVLATTAFTGIPEVMLPIIFYNLVQHIVAAVVMSFVPEPVTQTPSRIA